MYNACVMPFKRLHFYKFIFTGIIILACTIINLTGFPFYSVCHIIYIANIFLFHLFP